MLRIFYNTMKTRGLRVASKKAWRYFLVQRKRIWNKFPVYMAFGKVFVLSRVLVRGKNRIIRLLGYEIFYFDLRSLYMEMKDIFKNEIYFFIPESGTACPRIIDGGGYIGISVIYFSYLYPKSKIMVFEPSPNALKYLKRNIEINNLYNVTLIEAGLSLKAKEIPFEESETDAGKISSAGNTVIRTVPLSEYVREKTDFVKLNIEGSELEVLNELNISQVFQNIDQMCIEWHSFANQEQNLDEVLAILKKNGYKYLINHFDYTTNTPVRPPFTLKKKTQFYLLIYANKIQNMSE